MLSRLLIHGGRIDGKYIYTHTHKPSFGAICILNVHVCQFLFHFLLPPRIFKYKIKLAYVSKASTQCHLFKICNPNIIASVRYNEQSGLCARLYIRTK